MKFYFRISTCSLIILLAHYLIIDLTVSAKFIIPLWKIYVFNFTSLSLIYFGLLINFNHNLFNHLYFFVFATILKMIAVLWLKSLGIIVENACLTTGLRRSARALSTLVRISSVSLAALFGLSRISLAVEVSLEDSPSKTFSTS